MTDAELLRYAAIAGEQQYNPMFNPLGDDGQALRLAVKLCIAVEPKSEGHCMAITSDCGWMVGTGQGSPERAARRAITRAAAEIGKQITGDSK